MRLGDIRKAHNASASSMASSNDGSSSRIRKLPARKRVPTRKSGAQLLETSVETKSAGVAQVAVSPRVMTSPRIKVLSPKSPTVAFSNI